MTFPLRYSFLRGRTNWGEVESHSFCAVCESCSDGHWRWILKRPEVCGAWVGGQDCVANGDCLQGPVGKLDTQLCSAEYGSSACVSLAFEGAESSSRLHNGCYLRSGTVPCRKLCPVLKESWGEAGSNPPSFPVHLVLCGDVRWNHLLSARGTPRSTRSCAFSCPICRLLGSRVPAKGCSPSQGSPSLSCPPAGRGCAKSWCLLWCLGCEGVQGFCASALSSVPVRGGSPGCDFCRVRLLEQSKRPQSMSSWKRHSKYSCRSIYSFSLNNCKVFRAWKSVCFVSVFFK